MAAAATRTASASAQGRREKFGKDHERDEPGADEGCDATNQAPAPESLQFQRSVQCWAHGRPPNYRPQVTKSRSLLGAGEGSNPYSGANFVVQVRLMGDQSALG